MTDSRPIDRTTRISPIAALERHERIERGPADQPAPVPSDASTFDGVPATVPDDVLAEVDDALERLEDLRASGTSVRFHAGDGAAARIELVGPDGEGREVGPAELFRIVDGAPAPASPPTPSDAPVVHVDREA